MFKYKIFFRQGLTIFLVYTLLSLQAAFAQNALQGPSANNSESHQVGVWGIDLTDRDSSINPGDDFYMSQNGGWIARTELSANTPWAGYWRDLRNQMPRRLAIILNQADADKKASPDSPEGRARAFYRSFMNKQIVEERGLSPLKPELDAIRAAQTKSRMAEIMGIADGPGKQKMTNTMAAPSIGRGSVFSVNISQDQKDSSRHAVYLGQSGLNMPGPEYYLDPGMADIKSAYEDYVAKMLTLIGWENPALRAKEIVALETRIAEASWSREQLRDVAAAYNPMTVAELSKLAPGFDWQAFLKGAELGKTKRVVIDAKSAFPKIARIFSETPIELWRAREAFSIADDSAGEGALNDAAYNTYFNFRFKYLGSSLSPLPARERLAVNTVSLNIGEILSALYVKNFSSPAVKSAVEEMAVNLKKAFDARIQKLSWMSPETKLKAREKLAKMTVRIGGPDKFQDYAGLKISETDLYGNVARAKTFAWHRQVGQLDRPVDRSEWYLTPEYPNYSYLAATNTAEIPFAMMQAPFFDLHADMAVNYGAIGAQLGQVIVAGFDESGRHFDATGRLQDWWTPEEVKTFGAMRKALAERYSAIEPLPGLHVKGELVADEAIDDLGGMLIALDAYHLSLKGQPAAALDGFTGDQRFFLGRAQMWKAKFDPMFMRNQIAVGKNSHPFLRVNGPVRNIDAWYEAFDVKPENKMYVAPETRVRIW